VASLPRIIAAAVSLLIYAGISLMSSLPASSLPSGIPDFIPHGIEYALLGFFFIQVFAAPRRPATLALAFLLLALLGLLDEWHQLSTPGRVFSLLDLVYDALGSAIGMAVYLVIARRKRDA
jgi:VanZ family protein